MRGKAGFNEARQLTAVAFIPMPGASMRRIGFPPLSIWYCSRNRLVRRLVHKSGCEILAFRRSVASTHRQALAASLLVCCPMALHRPVRHAEATPAALLSRRLMSPFAWVSFGGIMAHIFRCTAGYDLRTHSIALAPCSSKSVVIARMNALEKRLREPRGLPRGLPDRACDTNVTKSVCRQHRDDTDRTYCG